MKSQQILTEIFQCTVEVTSVSDMVALLQEKDVVTPVPGIVPMFQETDKNSS